MFKYIRKVEDKFTLGNIAAWDKKKLMQEVRRLSNLSKRRDKNISANGYYSQSLELLKNRNEKILGGKLDIYTPYTVSKKLSISDLHDLILSYDRFLTAKDSTAQGLEFEFEDSGLAEKYSEKYGREITGQDLSKVFGWLKNSDYGKYLNAENFDSGQTIELIFDGKDTIENNLENIERFIRENPDDFSGNKLVEEVWGNAKAFYETKY